MKPQVLTPRLGARSKICRANQTSRVSNVASWNSSNVRLSRSATHAGYESGVGIRRDDHCFCR